MMRTSQLEPMLEKTLKDEFVTVCPVNELILDQHGIYVVNTDCSKGIHWVVLYVTNETVEFFDSFGRHPLHVQNGHMFMHSIRMSKKTLIVTSKGFQHKMSLVCGWYCLAYAYVRVKAKTVQKFYDMFTMDLLRNDKFVIFVVNTLYKC